MGSKCIKKYPRDRKLGTQRRFCEDGAEKLLKILILKMGRMQPQVKECWQPPEGKRAEADSPPGSPTGVTACSNLDFDPVKPIL